MIDKVAKRKKKPALWCCDTTSNTSVSLVKQQQCDVINL